MTNRVEKVSIALTEQMLAAIQEAVDSGEYASAGEVVRDALRIWRIQRRSQMSDPGAEPAKLHPAPETRGNLKA